VSRLLEGIGAVAGLVAAIAATQPYEGTIALIAVISGLAFGMLGYAIECACAAVSNGILRRQA
jgi:hypothetical protein